MTARSKKSGCGSSYRQEAWPTRGAVCRRKVRRREAIASITEKDDWREQKLNAGSKRDIGKWKRLWTRKVTDERGECMPEQSETFGSGSIYDQETLPTREVSGCRSKLRRPEVAVSMIKKYDRREGLVDAGAKQDIQKWQIIWLRIVTK